MTNDEFLSLFDTVTERGYQQSSPSQHVTQYPGQDFQLRNRDLTSPRQQIPQDAGHGFQLGGRDLLPVHGADLLPGEPLRDAAPAEGMLTGRCLHAQ